MKKNYTDITIILDRSGSMSHLRDDVIGGINEFIEEQRSVEGEATVSLIQFDNQYEINYIAKDIKSVEPLTRDTYSPRGSTSLLDAIGRTVNDLGNRLSSMQESDRPDKIIVLIQTDGDENTSREFKYTDIKSMITHQTDTYSWDFVFLGANINAKETASFLGIKLDNAMTFAASGVGTRSALKSFSQNTAMYRVGLKSDMTYVSSDYASQSDLGVSNS